MPLEALFCLLVLSTSLSVFLVAHAHLNSSNCKLCKDRELIGYDFAIKAVSTSRMIKGLSRENNKKEEFFY